MDLMCYLLLPSIINSQCVYVVMDIYVYIHIVCFSLSFSTFSNHFSSNDPKCDTFMNR